MPNHKGIWLPCPMFLNCGHYCEGDCTARICKKCADAGQQAALDASINGAGRDGQ